MVMAANDLFVVFVFPTKRVLRLISHELVLNFFSFPMVVPLQPNLENLTAVYLPALQAILDSPLNASGMVQAVYINFGRLGINEIRPQADFIKDSTPTAFENVLGGLFQTGRILRTDIAEELMLWIPDVPTVIARIQEDYMKIGYVGCLSGAGALDGTNLQEYLTASSNDQSYFFVVGNFADKEIDHHIENYVKVSQLDLNANAELRVVVNALHAKWGVL
ncbi:hypothetical protein RHMOL_Rhmol09G0118400 [Rhododendron molle]|uniref:Uncharacterized protein n=1 Tax=Rhododendron molle TaxID=49168 RepID=A0ACC0MD00_RHOML|nr:hypothetical protein RHMOL_Rhmol09G0118400 [Rhododendron molle]